MTSNASNRRRRRRRLAALPTSADRRGNTLVLVTAILVLLVIIATAYISRTQGGRVIAAAQRKAIDREDRADLAAGVVSREIADTLFPRLVDPSDPGVQAGVAATSSRTRLSRPFWNGQKLDRYMVDPQVNGDGAPLAPYNHAPYETRAWTNWPDSAGPDVPFGPGGGSGRLYDANGLTLGDDNPVGNPGFGDSRWLRSTEPERAYDTLGRLGFDNNSGQAGFTHWSHLSWPASAENGWRVCFDIANVAPFQGDYTFDPTDPADVRPREGFTLTRTTAELLASGAANDYLLIQDPVALQTPYEQWLPGNIPPPYAGTGDFISRRNLWFSPPSTHFGNSVLYGPRALPNFIRLNDLGPRRHALLPGTDRNVVERTLADTDGDGFTDSFWFLIPGASEDGIRQVAAVSVIDNASMVDVNVATRFDRFSTAGETPADVALTSRLVQPDAQATQFGANASVYDPTDTWTGLFSDPQNATPANFLWGLGYTYDTEYQVQPNTFDGPETLQTGFDPLRFGDSTSAPSSFLRQTGVLNQNLGATGFAALEAPYRSLMVSLGSNDPGRAAFDRRRYFHRRQNDGGLFTIRSAADGSPLSVDNWAIGNVPPRGFTDADELELRMFAASNYGPAVTTLERTLNEPWDYQANYLRSSLARSESVENFLDYYDGNENTPWPPNQGTAIGDQLSAVELLRDNRHRITTYSTTRNDLRPLHLRPTALYNPDFDYAFGRLRVDSEIPNALANQLAFDVRKQKVDLRAPTDTPLTEFESILYRYFPGPFNATASGNRDLMLAGVWPGSLSPAFNARVELDRSYRFRLELQQTIAKAASAVLRDVDGTPYAQSYLGSNYKDITVNQQDYLLTQILSASWSANIDTFRDARPRPAVSYNFAGSGGLGQVEQIELDTPIFPDWAPRVDLETDSFLPVDLRNLSFPGMEKQPFIMEAFFGLVYPPSRISGSTFTELNGDEGYQQLLQQQGQSAPQEGDDEIPFGFAGSGDKWVDADSRPAIVFAIQLANPFEEPVPLHDVFIRVGDSGSLNQCLNLAKLPSPHPLALNAGDTDPVTGQQRTSPYYFPSELFLGPTQPDAPRTAIVFGIIPPGNTVDSSFEDEFGVDFEEFHAKWMDFLDLESGALFGWDATLPMSQHQTMVFDASPETYARITPGSPGIPFKPAIPPLVGLTPDRWFDDIDQSVELLRFVVDPLAQNNGGSGLPTSGYLYAIDRLDNDLTGAKIEFSDQMERIVEDDFAPTMPQEYSFTFGGPPDRNEWSGIRLEGGDMLASWVRAGRAWGWDVNRNGVYDMTETSPRYVMSEIPEDDWVQTEVEAVVVGQGGRQINGAIIDWDEDPDTPWMARSYLSPLGIVPSLGAGNADGSYSYDFGTIRGKPTHLTTATALQPGGAGAFNVDYDAGFPVLADGTIRSTANPTGGPGRPASQYRWVLMDKGQEQDETLPGNRSGLTTGADGNNNGVDDGLETYQRTWLEKDQWAYPLQMLQKDADFEQVGEVFNPFLWGHAITHRPGQTTPQTFGGIRLLPTFMTFGEIMNSTLAEDPLPVLRADLSPVGVPNPTRTRTNRFRADPGNPTAQVGAAVDPFRAPTQVVEVTAFSEPWTPLLPAGLSVLDGLVCDGPGCNYRLDLNGNGALDPVELIAIEDSRFGNAAGFGGKGTRGLINVNTAPVEVLRTLPHMSRLVYNDNVAWPGTAAAGAPSATAWNGYLPSVPRAGDVQDNAVPREISTRNIQYNRAAEAIDQYRRGGGVYSGGGIDPKRVEQVFLPFGADVALPYYDDRGTFNYTDSAAAPQFATWVTDAVEYPEIPGTPGLFPGMRRGAGITSLGEIMLLERIGVPTAQVAQSWPQRSAAITGASLDPYGYQRDLGFGNTWGAAGQPWNPAAGTPDVNIRLGLGWRAGADTNSPPLQTDARLSTDRLNISWPQDRWNPATRVELPDSVAGDAEEANLLFAGISNLVSVRSDVFTVHLKLRSFKQNPVTGVWNATDPEFIVDDSRYVFVVDRSRCELPGDEPEIRLFSKIPN